MADPAHLAKLLEGVSSWNEWRATNPEIIPDLTEVDLTKEAVSGTALIGMDQKSGKRFVNLRGVNFREASLRNAQLVAGDLDDASLDKANLEGANLRGASLTRANLKGTNLNHAKLHLTFLAYANLQNASFVNADLSKAFLADANMRRSRFVGANLEQAHVFRVKFCRSSRQRCFQGIRVATCYGSQSFKTFAQDQDYIEELRASGWSGWLTFWVWWIFADCGRSFWRWAGWSILFAVLFGLKYYCMGPEHFDIGRLNFGLLTMMYYSVVTFTTLGFGDIKPITDWGLIVVMAEVILGYIMLGGLISIFANKLARRA